MELDSRFSNGQSHRVEVIIGSTVLVIWLLV